MYESRADRAKRAAEEIEKSGNFLLMDQAAFLLGSGREVAQWLIDDIVRDCPKLQVMMLEFEAVKVRPLFGLMLMPYIDRDDALGWMSDCIRKELF